MKECKVQWFTIVALEVQEAQALTEHVKAENMSEAIAKFRKEREGQDLQIIEVFKGELLGLLPEIIYTYDEEDR